MRLMVGSDHSKELQSKGLRAGAKMQRLDRVVTVPAAPIHAVPEGEDVALCTYTPRRVFDAPWNGSMWSSRDRCPECVEKADGQ